MHIPESGQNTTILLYNLVRRDRIWQNTNIVQCLTICGSVGSYLICFFFFFFYICRCQSICDLSFQLEQDLECRNSEVSKLQKTVSDLQVYMQQEREQVLRLYSENDRLQVYLFTSTFCIVMNSLWFHI
jgi:hypothetical protein